MIVIENERSTVKQVVGSQENNCRVYRNKCKCSRHPTLSEQNILFWMYPVSIQWFALFRVESEPTACQTVFT